MARLIKKLLKLGALAGVLAAVFQGVKLFKGSPEGVGDEGFAFDEGDDPYAIDESTLGGEVSLELLDRLVCPLDKGPLELVEGKWLVNRRNGYRYPITDGIPVMLIEVVSVTEVRIPLSDKVRVAIIGVGNCASSLVQGVEYYRGADPAGRVPGLMHVNLGGYHIDDIEFSAAFDIDRTKVGVDLSEAIWAGQNNTMRFSEVPHKGITVQRGMTHDGLGFYLKQKIEKAPGQTAPVAQILKDTGTDVVINYLPVGSEMATKWYVEQVLEAGCAFVNRIPVFIARENYWQQRFIERGLPMIGDDIKSQVGATIVHRVLTNLFMDRGVRLERTSQLNVGGNMDFYNMLERTRLESKKISKTNAVTSQLDYPLPPEDVYIGPSDYVPWLTDRKWAHIRLEGKAFGDVPLNIELKLEVWDSPNSAGVVIDAVRLAKIGLDRGHSGTLEGPSAYFMKSPPVQHPDDHARELVEAYIQGDRVLAGGSPDGAPLA